MVADNCETVWTIVVVGVLVRQIRFRLGIHYLMYFLDRLNVIDLCTVCKQIVARQWNFEVRLY
jgi:hypothetical protein